MSKVIFTRHLDEKLCISNPDKLIVFPDYLDGSVDHVTTLRNQPNTFGVPVKRNKHSNHDSYFNDREDEVMEVRLHLKELEIQRLHGKDIIINVNELGGSISLLKYKSPLIHNIISEFYKSLRNEIELKYLKRIVNEEE